MFPGHKLPKTELWTTYFLDFLTYPRLQSTLPSGETAIQNIDPRQADQSWGGEGGFYCISLVEAHRWDVEQKNVDILQYFTHFRNEPLYYEKWKVQTFQLYFISIHPMMLMKPLFKLLPKLKCQKLKIKTSVKHFSLYIYCTDVQRTLNHWWILYRFL